MAGLIKDDSTVLVIDGVPYSLVKKDPIKHNDVCALCNLDDIYCDKGCGRSLFKLCSPQSLGEGWFFKVDWDIANKQIFDYLDFSKEKII